MRTRCTNPNYAERRYYSDRGITVCDRWLADFWNFVEDMGPKPEGHYIDRIDNDLGYSPDNCRWASPKESAANVRPHLNGSARKTHCKYGHPLSGANLGMSQGTRQCRTCKVRRQREYSERKATAS